MTESRAASNPVGATTSAESPPCCGRHNGTMLCSEHPAGCCENCPDHPEHRATMTAAQRTLTLPCSSCGRSRTECRTVDNPFLSCCTECAKNDGDTHAPKPPTSAAATPLWITEAEGTWVARNPNLRYTAAADTLDDLRGLVAESAEAESWPGWVLHYAEEPEVTR